MEWPIKEGGGKLRIKYIIVVIIVLFTCTGCDVDRYKGKRPVDLGDARWVSTSPYMYFDVYENTNAYASDLTLGVLKYDGKEINFLVGFDEEGTGVRFVVDGPEFETLLYGYCSFSPDKFVVTIDYEEDCIFNGDVKEITFTKESLQ